MNTDNNDTKSNNTVLPSNRSSFDFSKTLGSTFRPSEKKIPLFKP